MSQQKRITELELAVRLIDDMLPDLPTETLHRWQGILSGTLAKVEKELTNTALHTCRICFFQEYGYRDELPSCWYSKGNADVCFQHEYADAEKLLREAGHDAEAFLPPEIPEPSRGSLKVVLNNLPPPAKENTLDELMALL